MVPPLKLLLGIAQKRVGGKVTVKGLIIAKALGLIGYACLSADRADDDLFIRKLINALGENSL